MHDNTTIESLSLDALFLIFAELPPETLLTIIPVINIRFKNIVSDNLKTANNFWEDKFKKHFSKPYRKIEYKADIENWLEHFQRTQEYESLAKPLRTAISFLRENDPDGFIKALDAAGGPTSENLDYRINRSEFRRLLWFVKKLNNPKIFDYIYEKNKEDEQCQLYWAVVCKRPLSEILPLLNEDDNHILELFIPPSSKKAEKKAFLLHLAAQSDHLDLVKYLIEEKKVNPALIFEDYQDQEFHIIDKVITPAALATRHSHLNILKYLLEEQKVSGDITSLVNEITLPDGFAVLRYLMEERNADISNTQLKIFLDQVIKDYDDEIFLFLITLAEQSHDGTKIIQKALVSAILNHDLDIIKFLIEKKKATLNVILNHDGTSHLYFAIKYYSSKTVQYFIEKGVDPNGICGSDSPSFVNYNKSFSALHFASQQGKLETVKVLVENGANTEAVDNKGRTPCDLAAAEDRLDIVEYFIKHETNLHRSKLKSNPLHAAIMHLITEPDNIRFQHKKPKPALKKFETRMTLAIKKMIDRLCPNIIDINLIDEKGRTPLHIASGFGLSKIIKYLIEKGATVSLKDHKGMTALHLAAKSGDLKTVRLLMPKNKKEASAFCQQGDVLEQTPIQLAILKNHFSVARFLINKLKLTEINTLNVRGFALLHYAAAANNLDTIKHLLKKGARVDQPDRHGATALYHIAHSTHFNLDAFKYLVEEGNANIHAPLDNGDTLLHCAIRTNNLALVRYLLQQGFPANIFNKAGHHALYYAVSMPLPNPYIIRCLVEEGLAEVNLCTFQGYTPLHFAAEQGNVALSSYLIQNGANVNAPTQGKFTSLHLAAEYGHTDVANCLIENGAIINPFNNEGNSPLDLARKHSHAETAKLLVHNTFLASIESNDPELLIAFLKSEHDPQTLENLFHLAIQHRCLPAIKFLAEKQNVRSKNKALISAVQNNFPEAVEFLLSSMNPNIILNGIYQTPLAIALYYKNKHIAECLLNHPKIKPDLFFFGGIPPIILAVMMRDSDIVKKMLAKNVNVNVTGSLPYETPLIAAVLTNNSEMVKLLLEAGADPQLHFLSPSPLGLAQKLNNPEIIALLSQDPPQKAPNIQISSAFFKKAPTMLPEDFPPYHYPKMQ